MADVNPECMARSKITGLIRLSFKYKSFQIICPPAGILISAPRGLWQKGPIEGELNENGHNGRVLAPIIGRYYGGASSGLSLI